MAVCLTAVASCGTRLLRRGCCALAIRRCANPGPLLASEVIAKEPFLKPFVDTMDAGTKFVPVDKAWTTIDAEKILPNMLQKVVDSIRVDQEVALDESYLEAWYQGDDLDIETARLAVMELLSR